MKKILIALMVSIMWLPLPSAAQQWLNPYGRPDGSQAGGRWATPQDGWQGDFSKPGTTNPMTGQFNTYGRKRPGSSSLQANPSKSADQDIDPYFIPGSTPAKSAPNPYAIPGSTPVKNANPYAIPGSTPASAANKQRR